MWSSSPAAEASVLRGRVHVAPLAVLVGTGLLLSSAARSTPPDGANGKARAEAIADAAPSARAHLAFLEAEGQRIRDARLRIAVGELLARPVPSFLGALLGSAGEREATRRALVEQGLLDPNVSVADLFPPADTAASVRAAPGGTLDAHHAWPGGLVEHTAFNLKAARALTQTYRDHYGLSAAEDIDDDVVTAAVILHDVLKAWVLQWRDDGTELLQPKVGGTPSHHTFVIAETLHRQLPPAFIVALASAHEPPGTAAEKVVGFIRAAAIIAKRDPVTAGLLVRSADGALHLSSSPGFEATLNHLSDHDYVLSDPAAAIVAPALRRLVRAEPDGAALSDADVRWQTYRIQSRVPHMRLYRRWLQGGDAGIAAELQRSGIPLLVPAGTAAKR